MRVSLAKISNDIVSLTVMALMSVAFIATQAQAGATQATEPNVIDIKLVEIEPAQVLVIDINFSFRSTGE